MVVRILSLLILVIPLSTASGQLKKFGQFDLNGSGFGTVAKSAAPKVDASARLVQVDARTVELQVTVTPPPDFYIYSTTTPKGMPTKITLSESAGLEPAQPGFTPDHAPKTEFCEAFRDDVEKYLGKVIWSQRLTSAASLTGRIRITGKIEGQICSTGDGGQCVMLRPNPTFEAELDADAFDPATAPAQESSSAAALVELAQNNSGKSFLKYVVSLEPSRVTVGQEVTVVVRADMAPKYHTYSITMPETAPGVPTEIELETVGLEAVDQEFSTTTPPIIHDDLEEHEGSVTWTRRFVVTQKLVTVKGTITGQVCSRGFCQRRETLEFTVAPESVEGASVARTSTVAGVDAVAPQSANQPEVSSLLVGEAADARKQGLFFFLLSAAVAGFVALLTPCVFPMIPVTVAFFLKQEESGRANSKMLAVIYCLGIVGSFTVIGILVSSLYGPTAMTQFANNPWVNLLFAIVFIGFGLVLMGVFELRLPTSMLNWSSRRESQGGIIGVMFMALTFTLVSFTCTAAFVAGILAYAAKGHYLDPILGMLAFSSAFASPFFFLALFPGFLSRLPKSGGWMQKVKCTAGLVELALAVKFLGVADVGFSATSTPVFLDFSMAMVIWATLSFVTGLYLLGVFRFSKDSPSDSVSPIGSLWAMSFLGLGLLICVGLFSPTKLDNWVWNRLTGFAPPRFETGVAGIADHGVPDEVPELANSKYKLVQHGLAYTLEFTDAVQIAEQRNRPIFIDFTGVNCQNCRDMENSVLNKPDILSILSGLPRAQLFLDEIPTVSAKDEKDRLLEFNQQLSEAITGGTAMPSYVLLSPDGERVIAQVSGLQSHTRFREFLSDAVERFEAAQASRPGQPVTTVSSSGISGH